MTIKLVTIQLTWRILAQQLKQRISRALAASNKRG